MGIKCFINLCEIPKTTVKLECKEYIVGQIKRIVDIYVVRLLSGGVFAGDVVVHIFLPPQRDYYNLEEFYGNATAIDLPFEQQQPFRG